MWVAKGGRHMSKGKLKGKHPRPRPPAGMRFAEAEEASRERDYMERCFNGRYGTADEQNGDIDPDDLQA